MPKICQKVKSKIQKRSNFNDFHSPKVKGKREKKKKAIQIFWLSLLYSQKDTRMD
jgi:hypothetical protein